MRTSWSSRPRAHAISVAEGRKETMRRTVILCCFRAAVREERLYHDVRRHRNVDIKTGCTLTDDVKQPVVTRWYSQLPSELASQTEYQTPIAGRPARRRRDLHQTRARPVRRRCCRTETRCLQRLHGPAAGR